MKKIVSTLIKAGFTVALFALLFWPELFGFRPDVFGGVKPKDLLHELGESQTHSLVFWLTFALLVRLSGMMCGVLRWRLLLRGQGIHIPFWYLTGSWFIGRTFGIFMPGTLGLDGYRLYDSVRYTGEVIKCTTVIAIEKLIGIIALTGLVFVTFPLGFRLLHINIPVLIVILIILGSAVAGAFLLLLNPRVIQVLVAVFPVPGKIRNQVNTLGAAATAYSNNRKELLLAVFFGFWVHFATCLMYFGTMMAIRATGTNLLDILFASPLMIYGTVIGPSIGGEGIREIVFVSLLGGKSSAASAATFAHLGWWVGDVFAFLVGLPVLIVRSRPSRAELERGLAAARKQAAEERGNSYLHLAADVVADYQRKVFACVGAGLVAGLIAGALLGLAESAWLYKTIDTLTDSWMFLWGASRYGALFTGAGLGVAGGLLFLYLLFDRFPHWAWTFALSLSGTFGGLGLIIGLWRFKRDVIALMPEDQRAGLGHYLPIVATIAGAALILFVAAYLAARIASRVFRGKPMLLIAAGVCVYALIVAGGYALSVRFQPEHKGAAFTPAKANTGPNIILVADDALRADYLKLYNPGAEAKIPQIEAFAKDAVLFENSFSQACWTKPSFATMFTGLYPGTHTATGKASSIPDEIETAAELLTAAGYYTKGFSNNPNTSTLFNFGQGFADYTDLEPDRQFGATASASKLSFYEVMRKIRQKLLQKLKFIPGLGGMNVADFYQPAEVVTRDALAWMDGGAVPKGTPFYLYLHYMDTHDPFMDHRHPGVGYARAVLGDRPPEQLNDAMREAYISEIEYFDTHFGALLDGLKARGLYDNSLIVFTGDHGEEFLDHGGFWHGYTLYNEMIHVPIAMKLPKSLHAGERSPEIARHIDLAPTFLQFAGAEKAEAMPGHTLFDAAGNVANAGTVYSFAQNDFEGNVLEAIRSKTEKLIHANKDNVSGMKPVEFYDLTADPAEKNNLAENPDRAAACETLNKAMDEVRNGVEANAAQPAADAPLDSNSEERLKALGYL